MREAHVSGQFETQFDGILDLIAAANDQVAARTNINATSAMGDSTQ